MNDMDKVKAEVQAKWGREEISDACARVIASWHHGGQATQGYAFVSTGAISDPSALWRELFLDCYPQMSRQERLDADMVGTYLNHHGPRGPVDGWSSLWV